MILPILSYPDPRLKRIAQPIAAITDDIRTLAQNMAKTMYDARGVGLAAPQVGESLRLVVLDPTGPKSSGPKSSEPNSPSLDSSDTDTQSGLRVLINPQLTPIADYITSELEGCLSVPLGYRADVRRCARVRVCALRLDGNILDEEWDGLAAIIVQHEVDHLDGKLFIDHISRLRRMLYEAKVKKQGKR